LVEYQRAQSSYLVLFGTGIDMRVYTVPYEIRQKLPPCFIILKTGIDPPTVYLGQGKKSETTG